MHITKPIDAPVHLNSDQAALRAYEVMRNFDRLCVYIESIGISPIQEAKARNAKFEKIKNFSGETPDLFAKIYFRKNLFKCAFSLLYLENSLKFHNTFLDLGTGPGTFIFPIQSIIDPRCAIGIDKSAKSLNFAKKIFDLSDLQTPNLIQSNAIEGIKSVNGVLTSSYMINELSRDQLIKLARKLDDSPSTRAIFIDQESSVVELSSFLRKRQPRILRSIKLQIADAATSLIGDSHVSFGILDV